MYNMYNRYDMYNMCSMYRSYGAANTDRTVSTICAVCTCVLPSAPTVIEIWTHMKRFPSKRSLSKGTFFEEATEKPAAILFSRKQGLGIPKHIPKENDTYIHNFRYCTLLIKNRRVLHINYIALAIDPFLGPCY